MTDKQWWVHVNDARIIACGQGATWWMWYRQRCELAARVAPQLVTIGGDIVRVACTSQDHAEWLATSMHRMGIPESCAKAVRA